nr:diguanylate cyclase [Raoultella sp. NCTC 9187]
MLDPLTGLYNRRGLQNRLDTSWPGWNSHHVLLLDIDHFKAYNDHYGHMMGDQALIQVPPRSVTPFVHGILWPVSAGRIYGAADQQHGGNRSAGSGTDPPAGLRFENAHMFNESVATNVTISIGLTPLVDADIDGALKRADSALYEAKNWAVILFSPANPPPRRQGSAARTKILPSFTQATSISNHYHLDCIWRSDGLPFNSIQQRHYLAGPVSAG